MSVTARSRESRFPMQCSGRTAPPQRHCREDATREPYPDESAWPPIHNTDSFLTPDSGHGKQADDDPVNAQRHPGVGDCRSRRSQLRGVFPPSRRQRSHRQRRSWTRLVRRSSNGLRASRSVPQHPPCDTSRTHEAHVTTRLSMTDRSDSNRHPTASTPLIEAAAGAQGGRGENSIEQVDAFRMADVRASNSISGPAQPTPPPLNREEPRNRRNL